MSYEHGHKHEQEQEQKLSVCANIKKNPTTWKSDQTERPSIRLWDVFFDPHRGALHNQLSSIMASSLPA